MQKLLMLILIVGVKLSCELNPESSKKIFEVPLNYVGDVTLHWMIDYETEEIQYEIHYPLGFAKWFAFGFSDYGELAPADYCILWANWKNELYFEDSWSDVNGFLHRDKQNDCLNFEFTEEENKNKFAFIRKIDTCDGDDYLIEEGTTHIIWVSGTDYLYDIEMLNIRNSSNTNKGMVRAQLLKNVNIDAELEPETWQHDVVVNKVQVPSGDTTYWCMVHKLPQQLKEKQHIIQFEAVIQQGNEGLVHHMEVFHCVASSEEQIPEYQGSCFADNRPNKTQVCKKVLAAWAMGALPFTYPPEAGAPIGGPDFNLFVMLEVHYNNPELRSDWVDSSGIRLSITKKLRKYNAGTIELGLEYIDKMAIPPNVERFPLSGYCIPECTEVGIPQDGIIVFGSQLHTHLTGVQIYTKHVRNGVEIEELNRDNHYSTHFQEIRRLKKPVKVLPGDALITTCYYTTTNRTNITLGGFAITDEMCVNYIHYYPATKLEVCKSAISDSYLQKYFTFMREYENQPTSNKKGISDNYNSIEWTPLRAKVLDDYYVHSPIGMQCNMSSGDRFPGYWDNRPIVGIIKEPLPPPSRDCSYRIEKRSIKRDHHHYLEIM